MEHRIRHYVYAGEELIPRTAGMRGAWPCEAKCSCGWETSTGGAVRSYIDRLVAEHKFDTRRGEVMEGQVMLNGPQAATAVTLLAKVEGDVLLTAQPAGGVYVATEATSWLIDAAGNETEES